jgi:hypothetical protein
MHLICMATVVCTTLLCLDGMKGTAVHVMYLLVSLCASFHVLVGVHSSIILKHWWHGVCLSSVRADVR